MIHLTNDNRNSAISNFSRKRNSNNLLSDDRYEDFHNQRLFDCKNIDTIVKIPLIKIFKSKNLNRTNSQKITHPHIKIFSTYSSSIHEIEDEKKYSIPKVISNKMNGSTKENSLFKNKIIFLALDEVFSLN